MSRRQAKVTQADVARAIRAAKQAGATDITVRPDGSIVIGLAPAIVSAPTVDRGKKPALASWED